MVWVGYAANPRRIIHEFLYDDVSILRHAISGVSGWGPGLSIGGGSFLVRPLNSNLSWETVGGILPGVTPNISHHIGKYGGLHPLVSNLANPIELCNVNPLSTFVHEVWPLHSQAIRQERQLHARTCATRRFAQPNRKQPHIHTFDIPMFCPPTIACVKFHGDDACRPNVHTQIVSCACPHLRRAVWLAAHTGRHVQPPILDYVEHSAMLHPPRPSPIADCQETPADSMPQQQV